jgi:hypothetical protein
VHGFYWMPHFTNTGNGLLINDSHVTDTEISASDFGANKAKRNFCCCQRPIIWDCQQPEGCQFWLSGQLYRYHLGRI